MVLGERQILERKSGDLGVSMLKHQEGNRNSDGLSMVKDATMKNIEKQSSSISHSFPNKSGESYSDILIVCPPGNESISP